VTDGWKIQVRFPSWVAPATPCTSRTHRVIERTPHGVRVHEVSVATDDPSHEWWFRQATAPATS
jgi:hypothetical protein